MKHVLREWKDGKVRRRRDKERDQVGLVYRVKKQKKLQLSALSVSQPRVSLASMSRWACGVGPIFCMTKHVCAAWRSGPPFCIDAPELDWGLCYGWTGGEAWRIESMLDTFIGRRNDSIIW
jgi:hypothetical protein